MINPLQTRIAVCALMLLAGTNLPVTAQDRSEEYTLKAVMLNRLMGFVSWENRDLNSPRTLCVAGQNPFADQLHIAFNGSDISVEMIGNQLEVIDSCDVLYVAESEMRNVAAILSEVSGKPILTISDIPRFASSGGMINLTFANRRVRFLINKEEADSVGVRLSFKLLSLADIVTTRGGRS